MTGTGMPEWLAEALCELMDLLRAGRLAGVSHDVEAVTGRPATSFEQFARDHADAFR
jgi:hypothetical protein